MSFIQKINIISHNLLWSKYKFILILIFYVIYLNLFNFSNNMVLCEEKSINNETVNTTNKLIGSTLFIGSIILILFFKSFGSSSSDSNFNVSPIIDQGANLFTQSVLSDSSPELLDTFTLNSNGEIMLKDVVIDTTSDKVYLNAEVIKQHFITIKSKAATIESVLEPLENWYILNQGSRNFPVVPQAFIAEHITFLDDLCQKYHKSELYNVQTVYLLQALIKAQVIPSDILTFYANFLEQKGDPTDFYSYYLQQYRRK